jgi:hypothetical protein
MQKLTTFYRAQITRFEKAELNPESVAGNGGGPASERAAWTAAARVLLNLDETITRP